MPLPCYCGHDCARCVTYLATRSDDSALRERSRAFYRDTFGIDLPLDAFVCDGGRSGRVFALCRDCPFVKCCREHGVEGCQACPEYPCPDIAAYETKYVNRCNQLSQADAFKG